MPTPRSSKIVCLSNVYDQNYHALRREKIEPCLSYGKRRDLFQCLEIASRKELIVISAPPKATERRRALWLPAKETKFSTHAQFFCCNWDIPKLRIPLSWFFYAWHVVKKTRSGDIVLIDNYEFIYIVAAYFVKMLRSVSFILEYEDGKHLTDKS